MKPVKYIVVVHTNRTEAGVLVETFVYYESAKLYYDQIGTANVDCKVMYDAHDGMKVLHSHDNHKRQHYDKVSTEGDRITIC